MSKIPKLRFKEFSGEWESKILDELSEKVMVGIASSTTHAYRKSGIIMFRNQNIKPNHLDDTDILYLDEEYEKIHRNKRLMPGDLLTARTGYPGTTCVVPSKYINTQTFTTLITRPNKNLAISEYLSQYINSDRGTKFFKSVEIGGGQKNVNAETMKSLPIFIPTLKEQEKIASFFSLIDDKISLQSEKVEALKNYKKGMMQKIFSRELRFKDDEGRDYPEWKVTTVEKIANLEKGFTPDTKNERNWIGYIPWLSIADMKQGKYISDVSKYISNDTLGKKQLVPDGTLIMSFKLTLGRLAIINRPMMTNEAICHFYWKNNNINTEYMYYYLSTANIESFGCRAAKGITLNNDSLNSIVVKLPVMEEQIKIADILMKIDDKLGKEQKKLDSLMEYKKGLLQQMFV